MTLIPDIEWCEVPAGEFIMGSDSDNSWQSDEKPQHTLNLPYSYKAAKYPITNAQYELFVEAGGYGERRYWTEAGWAEKEKPTWGDKQPWTGPRNYGEPFNLANHPIIGVSWYEAVAYCRWLTEVMRDCGMLAEGWQIRLPTEAEWEKAARGVDGQIYTWGNEFDLEKANSMETEVESTSAVGIFTDGVSSYGCHEMAGNVWEWCATKVSYGNYKPYPYKIENEWTEAYLEGNSYKTLRGGSWVNEADNLRCAYRLSNNPDLNSNNRGLRCFFVPIF